MSQCVHCGKTIPHSKITRPVAEAGNGETTFKCFVYYDCPSCKFSTSFPVSYTYVGNDLSLEKMTERAHAYLGYKGGEKKK